MQTAKGNILKKIREGLSHPTAIPFPKSEGQQSVYTALQQEKEIEFAERFTALQGKFSYCFDKDNFLHQYKQLMANNGWKNIYCIEQQLCDELGIINFGEDKEALTQCDAAVTSCEFLVARTGSILLSAAQQSGRNTSVYAPIHICVAYTSQVVTDIKDALTDIKSKYESRLPSLITLATGPSRTADIEKTLVVGVHGPKEVYVFLIEDL